MLRRFVAPLMVLALGACSDKDGPTSPNQDSPLPYANAAIMAVAVAVAHDGGGYFDNSFSCPRRGVVEYIDVASGRQATFTDCDTGNSIVLRGTVIVTGMLNPQSTVPQTLSVSGSLNEVGSSGELTPIDNFVVTGIGFNAGSLAPALLLNTSAMIVKSDTYQTSIPSTTSVQQILAPTDIVIGRLPNPNNSLDALTATDIRRLAVSDLMHLQNLLFGEAIESNRPAHQHVLACGTVDVAPDPSQTAPGYVRLTNTWNSCALEPGALVSGTFVQTYDAISGSRIAMRVVGPITIGGGVPMTTFSLIEWSLVPGTLPGSVTISGKLVAGSASRTFSYDVVLDD